MKRTRATRPDDEVAAFLDKMARALTSGDVEVLASQWDVPALVVSDDGVHAVSTLDEVRAFFGGVKDQYNERGVVDTYPDVVSVDQPSSRILVVRVRWPHLDADGDVVGAESSTYTLRRDDDGDLKLRVVLMHGEEPGDDVDRALVMEDPMNDDQPMAATA
jgi:hypothetical protein